jgi:hypothetical protein
MDLLRDADVHVTSAAGTDIRFHNRGGEMGKFRMIAGPERIPIMLAGQVTWEPNEPSMEGVLVADGILSPPEEVGLIAEPVRFDGVGRAHRRDRRRAGGDAPETLAGDAKGDPTLAPDRPCLAGLQSRYTGADGPHP